MRTPPIRILSVIHHPFFGGPQNQLLRLAGPLRDRGFETLAVLPDEAGNAFERLRSGGVDVVKMPLGRLRARPDWRVQRDSLRTMAGDLSRLAQLIREKRIDLVVVHGLVNPQGAVAARFCGRPVVWQILDTRTPSVVRLLFAPVVRGLASSVMTTGHGVAEAHPGLARDEGRLFTFFPPVDTELFAPNEGKRLSARKALGFEPREVVIGCVANLTPQKNLETFALVAESISRERSEVRFALFGWAMETHADYAAHLLASTNHLRESGRLIVRDVGADVPRHMLALDVFLATAGPRSEGISTTVLEAMSSGLPVVSTDVGAIREAVLHGHTGYLVEPHDRVALIQRVTELVDDRDRAAEMGTSGRHRAVLEFNLDKCADIHVKAFEAALARHSGRRSAHRLIRGSMPARKR